MNNLNKTYRQYDCLNMCLQRDIEKRCGCYWARYMSIDKDKMPQCMNSTDWECVKRAQTEFNEKVCIEECPLEYNSITYDLQEIFGFKRTKS